MSNVNGVLEIFQATESLQIKPGCRVPVPVIIARGADDGESFSGKVAEAPGRAQVPEGWSEAGVCSHHRLQSAVWLHPARDDPTSNRQASCYWGFGDQGPAEGSSMSMEVDQLRETAGRWFDEDWSEAILCREVQRWLCAAGFRWDLHRCKEEDKGAACKDAAGDKRVKVNSGPSTDCLCHGGGSCGTRAWDEWGEEGGLCVHGLCGDWSGHSDNRAVAWMEAFGERLCVVPWDVVSWRKERAEEDWGWERRDEGDQCREGEKDWRAGRTAREAVLHQLWKREVQGEMWHKHPGADARPGEPSHNREGQCRVLAKDVRQWDGQVRTERSQDASAAATNWCADSRKSEPGDATARGESWKTWCSGGPLGSSVAWRPTMHTPQTEHQCDAICSLLFMRPWDWVNCHSPFSFSLSSPMSCVCHTHHEILMERPPKWWDQAWLKGVLWLRLQLCPVFPRCSQLREWSAIVDIYIYIYTSLHHIWYMHIPPTQFPLKKCPCRWPVQTGFYKYRPSDVESNPKVWWREIPVVNDPLNRNALLREKVPQGFRWWLISLRVNFWCRIDGQTFWGICRVTSRMLLMMLL